MLTGDKTKHAEIPLEQYQYRTTTYIYILIYERFVNSDFPDSDRADLYKPANLELTIRINERFWSIPISAISI